MGYTLNDIGEYAASLYSTKNFDDAFGIFEKQVLKLGFVGVLYTYIPRMLLDYNFSLKPVYKVSGDYSPGYLSHYTDARFDKFDPLIKAVEDGITEPVDWWGETNKMYMDVNKESREVIATTLDYGITNAITLPLMSDEKGISGASFITPESRYFDTLKNENLDMLILCTKMFHNLVISDAGHFSHFLKPLLQSLSKTERSFLQQLARGKTPSQISVELNKSEKYLEQVMLRIRRKLSGTAVDAPPKLNRNQILYYTGLLGLINELN